MTVNLKDPVDVLARTLWGEARGQGYAGMFAVGCVVRNRAHSPRWWGHDVISVCLEPYQFSCWGSTDPNHAKLLAVTSADPQFAQAGIIAALIVGGGGRDTTIGSDSYFASSIPFPPWSARAEFTVQIGAHRFYRVELPAPGTTSPAKPHGDPQAPNIAMTADDLNQKQLDKLA